MFDVYDFCSDELKASLKLGRDYEINKWIEEDEKILSGKALEEEEKKEVK